MIDRIFANPLVSYASENITIPGRVSARFSDASLIEGLNILLQGSTYEAIEENGLIRFRSTLSKAKGNMDEESNQPGQSSNNQEVRLEHLAATDVVSLLSELFPQDEYSSDEILTYSAVAERNAVYLSGPAVDVARATRVVAQADKPVSHVIIEALVVDIDTSSVESLGVSFEDAASGSFSAASLIPGQVGGNLVASFSDLASNAAQVTATINFLAAQNAAHVLARPYIATQTTKTATIEIVDDQFARVDVSGDDSSIISTDSVTAGVTMEITPLVMAEESIRLDIAIEDSRFGATAGDIVITKQRSTASTSMIVKSGQTIMIGGLNSRYRITERSGTPWLQHIPILNLFASSQGALESRTELVVYLTPYIWVPGMDTPLPNERTPDPIMRHLTGSRARRSGGRLTGLFFGRRFFLLRCPLFLAAFGFFRR